MGTGALLSPQLSLGTAPETRMAHVHYTLGTQQIDNIMIIKIIKNLNSAPRRTKLPRPALCAHTMYMQRRKKDPWNWVWNAGCKGLIEPFA